MKSTMSVPALVLSAALMCAAPARDWLSEEFPETAKDTIQKTLQFSNPAAARSLSVDNVEGSILVTGYDGTTVEMEAARTIKARSKEDVELAKKEVELQISEKNNRIELYVDGPFRCENRGRRERRLPYRVNYDFRIKIPRSCNLDLSTVNNGDIRVENVDGKFDVENINGKVDMNEVAGSGRARTINGGLSVRFSRNPEGDCSFGSINGNVDVAFRPGLSADCWFKTFNGSAYTDFQIQPLPQPVAQAERSGAKFVYKSSRFAGVRIGKGGPQFKFDTLNGNIHVTER